MRKLKHADYLVEQKARSEDNDELQSSGLGSTRSFGAWAMAKLSSPIRSSAGIQATQSTPNIFFRDMYRDFAPAKRLRAEDHTGYVKTDDRADREDRFRADWFIDEKKTQPDHAKIRSNSIAPCSAPPQWSLASISEASRSFIFAMHPPTLRTTLSALAVQAEVGRAR